MRSIRWRLAPLSLVLLLAASVGRAQEPPAPPAGGGAAASDLAKATQNPISDLTAIPFQFNFFSGGPLEDRSLYNLNFQPVLPIKLGKYNLIARTIVPYLDIPVGSETDRVSGFGDIQQQFFFSPADAKDLVIGVGPIFSYPTATNDVVRTGDWAVGPTAVLVKITGPWVLGAVVSQLWTFAGDDIGPNVNLFTLQPFINYNLADGWALAFAPIITANWAAEDDDVWTVPLGIGISKVTVIGRQPLSLGIQYYNNVERPSTTGQSQLRIAVSLLFPNPPAKK